MHITIDTSWLVCSLSLGSVEGMANPLYLSYTILIFICSFVFNYLLDSVMPLFHVLYPIQQPLSLCPSITSSILCSLSSITSSLPHFCLLSSIPLTTCSIFCLLTPCSFVLFLSLPFQHLFITPCLPIPTLTTYHSVSCDTVSHFLHSPHYSEPCSI